MNTRVHLALLTVACLLAGALAGPFPSGSPPSCSATVGGAGPSPGGGGDDGAPEATRATTVSEWTFMVYMAADNNLERFAIQDLNEMEEFGSRDDVKIVAQMDRHPKSDSNLGYDSSNGDWTDTRRFYVTQDDDPKVINSYLVESLGEMDMSHPQTLMDFLRWGMGTYPAERYVLVMWDHGDGIFSTGGTNRPFTRGFNEDWTNGTRHMQLWELRRVLEAAMDELNGGGRFDLVAFDQCFMGHVETACELAGVAEYLTASADEEPDVGWDYSPIIEALVDDPGIGTADLARLISREFIDLFAKDLSYVTQAAVELAPFCAGGKYSDALGDLADALIDVTYEQRSELKAIRAELHEYKASNVDPYDFASRVQSDASFPSRVREAAAAYLMAHQEAVLHYGHGSGHPDSRGLAIYFPTSGIRSDYDSKLRIKDHPWNDFLHHYVSPHEMSHGGVLDTESFGEPVQVEAELEGGKIRAETFQVHFRAADEDEYFTVPMQKAPGTNRYTATFPGQPGNMTVFYYFTVEDTEDYTFYYPRDATPKKTETLYSYIVGPDNTPPDIAHQAPAYIPLSSSVELEAVISDAFGMNTSSPALHYRGGDASSFTEVSMVREGGGDGVLGGGLYTVELPAFEEETTVRYYITASDLAAEAHTARAPPVGTYTVQVSYRPGPVLLRPPPGGDSFEGLADAFEERGFRVNYTDTSRDLTPERLADHKTLVIACLSCTFSDDEVGYIRDFVEAGGELLITPDTPGFDAPEQANEMMEGTYIHWSGNWTTYGDTFDEGTEIVWVAANSVGRVMIGEGGQMWDGDAKDIPQPLLSLGRAMYYFGSYSLEEALAREPKELLIAMPETFPDHEGNMSQDIVLAATGYLGDGKVAAVAGGLLDDASPFGEFSRDLGGWIAEWLGRNEAPVAHVEGDLAVEPGQTALLDASSSYDVDGEIASYHWELPGEETSDTAEVEVSPDGVGVYPVTLTVEDAEGGIGYVQFTVNVSQPPVASFTVKDHSVLTGQGVKFTSAGHDPDGYIASYLWDYGDGHFGTGAAPVHSYGGKGIFTPSLTVTDNLGVTAFREGPPVEVRNRPPVAVLTAASVKVNGRSVAPDAVNDNWSLVVVEDDVITFNGSTSHDPDSGPENLTFMWQTGDGVTVNDALSMEHVFTASGNYTVILRVTDEEGETSVGYMVVAVVNAPPKAMARIAGRDGMKVTLDASSSKDTPSDRDNLEYRWDMGNGETVTTREPRVTYSYGYPGTYDVVLTVVDDDGEEDAYEFQVKARLIGKTTGTMLAVAITVIAAICAWWYTRGKRRRLEKAEEAEASEEAKGGKYGKKGRKDGGTVGDAGAGPAAPVSPAGAPGAGGSPGKGAGGRRVVLRLKK